MPARCGSRPHTLARTLPVLLAALLPAAVLPAQNLLLNPDFHTAVDGWQSGPGLPPQWTNLSDEGGCAGSGLALVVAENSPPLGYYATLLQCVPIATAPPALYARARYLSDGQVSLFLDYYTSSNCSAGGLGFHTATFPPSPAVWADATIDVAPMANAHGVKLRLNAIDPAPHSLKVDAAYLGRFEPIFRDGFDGNTLGETQPCRWSAP